MQAYLSPIGGETDDLRRIVLEDQVGLYRDGREVYATVEGRTVDFGISDPTVSRMKNGAAPIQFDLSDGGVVVRNAGNTNGVTVDTGIDRISVDTETERELTQDCTVEIGFNTELQLSIEKDDARSDTLSMSELQKRLNIEAKEGVISGVDPAAHVQSVATNLRREAAREAANECLKFANELADFVEQRPVDDDAYEDAQEDLEMITNGLRRKVTSDSLKGSGLDKEWQDRIDRVTHRVENMYARADQ